MRAIWMAQLGGGLSPRMRVGREGEGNRWRRGWWLETSPQNAPGSCVCWALCVVQSLRDQTGSVFSRGRRAPATQPDSDPSGRLSLLGNWGEGPPPLHRQTRPFFSTEMVSLPDQSPWSWRIPVEERQVWSSWASPCNPGLCEPHRHMAPGPWLRNHGLPQTTYKGLLGARLCLESSHHWELRPRCPRARTQGPRGRLSSPLISVTLQSFFQGQAEQATSPVSSTVLRVPSLQPGPYEEPQDIFLNDKFWISRWVYSCVWWTTWNYGLTLHESSHYQVMWRMSSTL